MTEGETLRLALKRAFQLGQDYWYQADHESYRENKKSDATLAKFRQLVDETCEALAEQPVKILAMQVRPSEFAEIIKGKDAVTGIPAYWAEWPNKEKIT